MIIPDDILKTLLCSKCHQYLSIPPIKVFPNRHVKCGRCSEENDKGVISHLYASVVRDFLFPCVNRFEGCEQILNQNEMKKHEEKCYAREYDCPFCSNFNGTAYYLQLHLKSFHTSDALHSSDFIVKLDKGNIQRTTWYCQNAYCLLILFYNYDTMEQILYLNITVVGESNREHLVQRFTIYNSENEVKIKTKSIPCSLYDSNFNMPKWHIPLDVGIINPSVTSVKINWVFKDISKLEPGFAKRKRFEPWFYVNNIKWNVVISRKSSRVSYLCIYLEALNSENLSTPELLVEFTLLSTKKPNKYCKIPYQQFKTCSYSNRFFMRWSALLDESNGYVQNDSIKIEVFIKCRTVTEETCSDCHICDKCAGKVVKKN